jgi:hypothetical protein
LVGANGPIATFHVELVEPGLDVEDLDLLTVRLRRQLLETDVVSVTRPPGGEPPAGARAVDAAAVGSLLVTLTTTAAALRSAVGTVRGWLAPTPTRAVTMTIDGDSIAITGVPDDQERDLVALWIARHSSE